MEVEHRLTFHADEATRKRLRLIGCTASLGLNTVMMRDSDPRWAALSQLFRSLDGVDFQSARFTRHELDGAKALGLIPDWHHGYPQPEDEYLSATYDLSDYCNTCGGGAEQVAPFRMKREPRWGARSILQLNWVFDEHFTTREVWERVFKPLGIESREVLSARSLKPLSTVLQLVVRDSCDLEADAFPFQDCSVCKRRRYLPISADFLPAVRALNHHIVKSHQAFGSGASFWRQIICSQMLRRALLKERLKGASFHPCRN